MPEPSTDQLQLMAWREDSHPFVYGTRESTWKFLCNVFKLGLPGSTWYINLQWYSYDSLYVSLWKSYPVQKSLRQFRELDCHHSHILSQRDLATLKPAKSKQQHNSWITYKRTRTQFILVKIINSLRKQPMFHEVATWALAKRPLSNKCRNSILMTWHLTTQILVVLLISWKKTPTNQKHYQDLGSVMSSAWHLCTHYSEVVLQGLKWRPHETSAVFSG